jgi:hypothetical protein
VDVVREFVDFVRQSKRGINRVRDADGEESLRLAA